MKTFSFIAGNLHDPSHGMTVAVDRSRLPPAMRVRLQLDDDGKAFPHVPRPVLRRPGNDVTHVEFVERTKLRVRLGDMEGHLHVEAGTRFESTGKSRLGDVKASGAIVSQRGPLRVAEITAAQAEFGIDKLPNDFHVFTIEADKPAGARPGEYFRVDVTQRDASGNVTGGIAVMFNFD